MGPWLKVSSYRLVKPGIEPATPGLQGKRFINYTTAAPIPANVTFEFVFRHRNFPPREGGWNLQPLAPEASAL